MTAEPLPTGSEDDPVSDEQIVSLLQAGSEDGVCLLLVVHGSHARKLLLEKFGEKHEGAIDEAISDAACTLWFKRGEFDPTRGSLGAWFFSCARNALRITLRAERTRPLLQILHLEEHLHAPTNAEGNRSAKLRLLLWRLNSALDQLSDMQRDIIYTDLAESGLVNNADLADKWRTSTNSIHVSRNKAHKRLARILRRKG